MFYIIETFMRGGNKTTLNVDKVMELKMLGKNVEQIVNSIISKL